MTYYVGDRPAEDLVIEPARNGEPIELTPFNSCSATLFNEAGEEVASAGFLATLDQSNDTIVVEWPGGEIFATAGVHTLVLFLESEEGARERLAPVFFVVQAAVSDGWLNLDAAREDWPNAESIPDRVLYELLAVAKNEVLAYAPALAQTAAVPVSYRKAQGMHARNIWNASKVDPATGGEGEDTFAIRPFPLDWSIKQMLRPKRAVPVIV